jgi:hypothetical protein
MKQAPPRDKMTYEVRRRWLSLLLASAITATFLTFLLFYFFSRKSDINYLLAVSAALLSVYAGFTSAYLSKKISKPRSRDKVFIIYDESDIHSAKEISRTLTINGFLPWLDVEEVLPGQRINIAIEEGLDECSSAIILVSSRLNINNPKISHILAAAMSSMSTKDNTYSPVIPVLLDDSPAPSALGDIFAVRYQAPGYMDDLIRALNKVARGV